MTKALRVVVVLLCAPSACTSTDDDLSIGPTEVVAVLDAGGRPDAITSGFGSIWVTVSRKPDPSASDAVLKIDPANLSVVMEVETPGGIGAIAVGEDSVWVTTAVGILRLDPDSGRLLATLPVCELPSDLLIFHGSVWVACNFPEGLVTRLDLETGQVQAEFQAGMASVHMAAGQDMIWVASPGRLTRIDPNTDQMSEVAGVESGFDDEAIPVGLAVGSHAWVSTSAEELLKIDLGATGIVWTVDLGIAPAGVVLHGGQVWVAGAEGPLLVRVDPRDPDSVEHWRVASDSLIVNYDATFAVGDELFWFPVLGNEEILAVEVPR